MSRRQNTPPPVQLTEPHAIRNRWRSVIDSTCLRHAALLEILPWGESDLRKLPSRVYEIVLRKRSELLDEACIDDEQQRRPRALIEQHLNATLWNLLKLYRPVPQVRAGETAQLPLDTGTPI